MVSWGCGFVFVFTVARAGMADAVFFGNPLECVGEFICGIFGEMAVFLAKVRLKVREWRLLYFVASSFDELHRVRAVGSCESGQRGGGGVEGFALLDARDCPFADSRLLSGLPDREAGFNPCILEEFPKACLLAYAFRDGTGADVRRAFPGSSQSRV